VSEELRIRVPEAFEPLEGSHRYIGAHGGRGSGKSHYFGERWLLESIRQRIDVVCLRETLKSLEFSVRKLLVEKISRYNAGAYFDVQDRRILSALGGTTIFEGMQNHTADSIKSLEGFDVGWFAEAQSASEKSLTLLRPTIRKPGSQLWFDWNPDQPTDPIDELLRGDVLPPDAAVVQVNFEDNPWFPDELRMEMEYDRSRDIDKYNHVWRGGYNTKSEARVFRNWRVEEFDVDADWIIRQGIDFGYSIDPSVLVQCAIVGRTLYVPHEAYMVGCEIDALPALFMTVPGAEKWPSTADSSRPETISYLSKHGFPRVFPAVKGARSLEEGVEFLKSFDIVVHPRCVHTVDELTAYSYKCDQLTGKVLPVLEDKHNHVIDALRYACEGARRAGVKPAPKSDNTPRSWMG
jgi:phage terminase large subunit